MRFDIREQTEYKLLVTTYSQEKLNYKDVYTEFDKCIKEKCTSWNKCKKVKED